METKIEKSCSAHSACFTPLVGIPQCFPSLVPHTPLSLVHTRTQPTNRLSYPIQPKPSLSRSLDLVAHSSRNAQGSQARSSRPPLWHRNAWSRQEGYVLSPSITSATSFIRADPIVGDHKTAMPTRVDGASPEKRSSPPRTSTRAIASTAWTRTTTRSRSRPSTSTTMRYP